MTIPLGDIGMPQVLGEARNGEDMLAVFRATKERLGLANRHCDELANFTEGQTDKILGPSGSKNFGPLTFTALNWMLAVKWIAVLDLDQAKVMEQYWEDRQRDASNVRPEPNRVSKKLIERAKPHVLKDFAQLGVVARINMLTGEQRTAIARKAAKSRWRQQRKGMRERLRERRAAKMLEVDDA
jgi:hypothetical protein